MQSSTIFPQCGSDLGKQEPDKALGRGERTVNGLLQEARAKANKIAREHIRNKMESVSSGYQSRLSVLERVLVHMITDM